VGVSSVGDSSAQVPWWARHSNSRSESAPVDYSGSVGTIEYAPGDVVYFPAGPFWGVCGVVREVDARRAKLRIDFNEGLVHREGGVLSVRRHSLTAGFDEVELA
jgi:hypothetical protein